MLIIHVKNLKFLQIVTIIIVNYCFNALQGVFCMVKSVSGYAIQPGRYQQIVNSKTTVIPNFTKYDSFKHSVSFKSHYDKLEALNYIKQAESNNLSPDGKGWQCAFFKISDDIGIKIPSPYSGNPNPDRNGINNIKEFYVLNKLRSINPELATTPIDLIQKDNKNYLVMNLIKGVHPVNGKFNPEQIDNLIQKTLQMDINGIVNNDLQNGNIFLQKDNTVKFIDFGSSNILLNDGSYLSTDAAPVNYFDKNGFFHHNTNSPADNKFLATFYNQKPLYDMKNNSENPYLKIKSNISNFEHRCLYDYLMKGNEEDPVKFFTGYLKAKAKNYHENLASYLESLKVSKNTPAEYEMVQNAIETEKLLKDIFENPDEGVIKTELGKIQIKWLLNSQENYQKTPSAFKEFIKETQKYLENADFAHKEYFQNSINYVNDMFNEVPHLKHSEAKILPDSENILKKFFKSTGETVLTEIKNFKSNSARRTNKKIIYILGSITAAGTGIGSYMYNRKPVPKPPQIMLKA